MSEYSLLVVDSVPDHVAARPALAARLDPTRITNVREVGDGNLNLVFVVETSGAEGLVLKQSLPYVRVDPAWPVTPERNGFEANALAVHGAVAPEFVPALYDVDNERHILAVEDLSDHQVWRTALNEGVRHEGAGADLGRYLARVAFGTSVFGLAPAEHKAAVVRSVNPELCRITEDLVFTEPYIQHEHNSVRPDNEPDVAAYAQDLEVRAAIGVAKLTFMTHAEALIHGDLHTGSVLVRAATPAAPRSTKAFDSEFAFYGPVGFDMGALWGNYLLAAARAVALGNGGQATWILAQATETWDAFEEEFRLLWPDRVDVLAFEDGTLETFLGKVRGDAAAAAGAKAARRIIGFSKVSDIETLPEDLAVAAARSVLHAARHLLVEGPAEKSVSALFDRVGDNLAP